LNGRCLFEDLTVSECVIAAAQLAGLATCILLTSGTPSTVVFSLRERAVFICVYLWLNWACRFRNEQQKSRARDRLFPDLIRVYLRLSAAIYTALQ
jgi:hypothetical protein